MDAATFRNLALSFPESIEEPHWEKASFRVRKKIFATLSPDGKNVTLKLSLVDQSVFTEFDKTIIYPVPNKWGKQGWTIVDFTRINDEMLKDVLISAYCEVAPKKLGDLVNKSLK